jgi:amino acid transporter
MTRILFSLASLSLILLVTALILGLSMGDLYAPRPTEETLAWATTHRLTGVAAALAVVFVESVVITYFIGTSRWCREVVETYRLDPSAVQASNRLKRRTFPWALLGMLAVVGIIALGGAADPATGRPNTQAWANWHLVGAIVGISLVAWTYVVAWNHIVANQEIIQRLVSEVQRIRSERGLQNGGAPAAKAEAHSRATT